MIKVCIDEPIYFTNRILLILMDINIYNEKL